MSEKRSKLFNLLDRLIEKAFIDNYMSKERACGYRQAINEVKDLLKDKIIYHEYFIETSPEVLLSVSNIKEFQDMQLRRCMTLLVEYLFQAKQFNITTEYDDVFATHVTKVSINVLEE